MDIRYYGKLLKYVKITLVEAGNAVLAVFDEALQNEAMRKLTGKHHTYTYSLPYTESFISVITESLGKRCTWDDRWLWYCCRRNPPNRGIHWISHWISLVQELARYLRLRCQYISSLVHFLQTIIEPACGDIDTHTTTYTYTYNHTHIYIHTLHTHIYTNTHYIHTYTHAHTHTSHHRYLHSEKYSYTYMYIRRYIRICILLYAHRYLHT